MFRSNLYNTHDPPNTNSRIGIPTSVMIIPKPNERPVIRNTKKNIPKGNATSFGHCRSPAGVEDAVGKDRGVIP